MIEHFGDCIVFTSADFYELLAKWKAGYRSLTKDENTMLYSGINMEIVNMENMAEIEEMKAILKQLDEQERSTYH
jgi:hypothetical protein